MITEIRTYVGEFGTTAFDGFRGLRMRQRYAGVVQEGARVLVSVVGAPVGTDVTVTQEEWGKWFGK